MNIANTTKKSIIGNLTFAGEPEFKLLDLVTFSQMCNIEHCNMKEQDWPVSCVKRQILLAEQQFLHSRQEVKQ